MNRPRNRPSARFALVALATSGCLVVFDENEYVTGGAPTASSTQATGSTSSASSGSGGEGGSMAPPLAPCDNGKCVESKISVDEWNVDSLVVHEGIVYWANAAGNDVRKAPVLSEVDPVTDLNPEIEEVATDEAAAPGYLVTDGQHLYWRAGNLVRRAELGLGTKPVQTVAELSGAGTDELLGLAVHGAYVYFSAGMHVVLGNPSDKLLYRAPKDPNMGSIEQIGANLNHVYEMEVWDSDLWLTDTATGDLSRAAIPNGPNDIVIDGNLGGSNPWTAQGLAINSRGVYWCHSGDDVIYFLPHGSSVEEQLVPMTDCDPVVGDDNWLYWADDAYDDVASNQGKLMAMRLSDGETFTLPGGGIQNPNALAFDDDALYYGTFWDPGLIVRVPVNR